MIYDERELFLLVPKEKVKKGCVVKICTSFDDEINKHTNTILITDDNKGLKAVWYEEGDYSGKPYIILDYQIITEIVKTNVDVEKYLNGLTIKYSKDYQRNDEWEEII